MKLFLTKFCSGWIKVFRSILDCDFLFRKDEHFCRFGAFVYLLLSASIYDQNNNEPGRDQNPLPAHSVRFSVQDLQDIFHWSSKEVRVFLKGLEKQGVIHRRTSPNGTVITFQSSSFYEITGSRKTGASAGANDGANDGANLYNNLLSSSNLIKKQSDEEASPSLPHENSQSLLSDSVPYGEITRLYDEICVSLPKIHRLTESRKELISQCWDSIGANLDAFRALFAKAEHAKFLVENSSGWKPSFDWLLDPKHACKIVEGEFDIVYNYKTSKDPEPSKPRKSSFHNFAEREENYDDLIRQYYEE